MRLDILTSQKVIFPLLICTTALLVRLAFVHQSDMLPALITSGIEALLLWLLWKGVVKPARMVQRGMELLSTQESNNRLAVVGQPDADRIALLFNTLMSRLHEQRLYMHEQNSFLQQLIKVSPMGIAVLDFDGRISDVNPAFRRLAMLPDNSEIKGMEINSLPGNIGVQIGSMDDGDIRLIKCEDHNILRCYLLTFMDRGFRRRFILLENLTDEVMQAERNAYGKVIRIISHEVNNSMTGIISLLDILSKYHRDDPELNDFIGSVSDRCRAMGRFISSYADVVRLPEPMKETLNLSNFLNSQLIFLRSNSPYPVECEPIAKDMIIEADADMFSQMLVNLIKNSSEAISMTGRQDGKIVISAEKTEQNDIILTVTDNGCGIPPETAKELFNPFFSTKPDGQGIGLTMVAEILRRHTATFSLRTDSDNLTRFRIHLKQIRIPAI